MSKNLALLSACLAFNNAIRLSIITFFSNHDQTWLIWLIWLSKNPELFLYSFFLLVSNHFAILWSFFYFIHCSKIPQSTSRCNCFLYLWWIVTCHFAKDIMLANKFEWYCICHSRQFLPSYSFEFYHNHENKVWHYMLIKFQCIFEAWLVA